MTDLGTLGGTGGRASNSFALNELGQVVGQSYTAGNVERHAFLYDNGILTDLGTLGGTNSYPQAINDGGQIVGSSSIAGDVGSRAVLWENGMMTELSTLGGTYESASDINELGWIVGTRTNTEGETRATLWRLRTPVDPAAGLTEIADTLAKDAGN
jgi:probable HAF family extracellular repeat protein